MYSLALLMCGACVGMTGESEMRRAAIARSEQLQLEELVSKLVERQLPCAPSEFSSEDGKVCVPRSSSSIVESVTKLRDGSGVEETEVKLTGSRCMSLGTAASMFPITAAKFVRQDVTDRNGKVEVVYEYQNLEKKYRVLVVLRDDPQDNIVDRIDVITWRRSE